MINIPYSIINIENITEYNTTEFVSPKTYVPYINFQYCKVETGFEIVKIDITSNEVIQCVQELDTSNRYIILHFWFENLALNLQADNKTKALKSGIHICGSNCPIKFNTITGKNSQGYLIILNKHWLNRTVLNEKMQNFFIYRGEYLQTLGKEMNNWKLFKKSFHPNSTQTFLSEWDLKIAGWELLSNFCKQLC